MNDKLEKQLAEQFPFMKRGNPYEDPEAPRTITNAYAAFSYEMADGWYSVIKGLCEDITAAYERAGEPVNLKPVQIKEKFGTLRFYYTFEEDADVSPDLWQEIDNIVDKWEHKSATVCEECGADGKLRHDLSYILTLCDTCYRKKKEPHYEEPYVITDEQIKEFQRKHLKNVAVEEKNKE